MKSIYIKCFLCLLVLFFSVFLYPQELRPKQADIQFFGDFYISKRFFLKNKFKFQKKIADYIQPLLKTSRLNVVNFEGSFDFGQQPRVLKTYHLKMPISVFPLMKKLSIQVITLANNHSLDFGELGLDWIQGLAKKHGIKTLGAGENRYEATKPLYIPGGRYTICLLNFSRTYPSRFWAKEDRAGTSYASLRETVRLTSSCVRKGFITFVVFHWGGELLKRVKPYQRTLAEAVIDAGAISVIGHHPHVVQPIVLYKNRPIFFSVGNFLFTSMRQTNKLEGIAVRFYLNSLKEFFFDIIDLKINNYKTMIKSSKKKKKKQSIWKSLKFPEYCKKFSVDIQRCRV